MRLINSVLFINIRLTQQTISKCNVLYNYDHPQVQNGSHDPTVSAFQGAITKKGVVAKKKYKPVALKVRPVIAELPEWYCIHRHINGDPLQGILTLNLTPNPFTPTGRYTLERHDEVDRNYGDFLWDEEHTLMHNFMFQQNRAFAWNNTEKG